MATRLRFTKMHGLGNDFVVFDGVNQTVDLRPEQLRQVADRHFGVGCDQILLVERPHPARWGRFPLPHLQRRRRRGAAVRQRRPLLRAFRARQGPDRPKREIRVETASGIIVPKLEDDGQVTVDMGPPRFEPADIPFVAEARAHDLPCSISASRWRSSPCPWATRMPSGSSNVDTAPVAEWGPLIEHHPRFPERVNVGFMQTGVGAPSACACSSAAAAKPWPAAPAPAPPPSPA
jgi:diaminopimelate epimerase